MEITIRGAGASSVAEGEEVDGAVDWHPGPRAGKRRKRAIVSERRIGMWGRAGGKQTAASPK
jgi:hypothetical protein